MRELWNPARTRALAATLLLVAMTALAACSDGESDNGSGKKVTVATAPPESGCGSFEAAPPPDPDGVVKGINNAAYTEGLSGYPSPILKSTWADWRPKGDPPYTVGVAWNQLTAPFQISTTKAIRDRLNESPIVDKVIFSSTGAETDVGKQIQQMNTMLRRKPDIIILEPLTAPSFAKQYRAAAKAGIPVLLALDSYDSPDVVNVGGNNVLSALEANSVLVRLMGGKGNLLFVGSIPGSTPEVNTQDAMKEILGNCPEIKKVGEIFGLYSPTTARSETLKYLGTNAQQIDGVSQTATMASGIMQAFDQAGRPIPPTVDVGVTKGSLGYWNQNKDTYTGTGTGLGGISYGRGLVNVALRMLEGQGLKTNAVIQQLPVITDDNLDQWAEPDWDLNTPGTAEGPIDEFIPDSFLDPLFANPAPPKTK